MLDVESLGGKDSDDGAGLVVDDVGGCLGVVEGGVGGDLAVSLNLILGHCDPFLERAPPLQLHTTTTVVGVRGPRGK